MLQSRMHPPHARPASCRSEKLDYNPTQPGSFYRTWALLSPPGEPPQPALREPGCTRTSARLLGGEHKAGRLQALPPLERLADARFRQPVMLTLRDDQEHMGKEQLLWGESQHPPNAWVGGEFPLSTHTRTHHSWGLFPAQPLTSCESMGESLPQPICRTGTAALTYPGEARRSLFHTYLMYNVCILTTLL